MAFDIDNTLAEINKPILKETVEKLLTLEKKGIWIAFVSGKPAIYISGMVRQVGLREAIVIGENGLNIYYGCAVPPRVIIDADVKEQPRELLREVHREVHFHFKERVWFQPNAVSVTAFPRDIKDMPELRQMIEVLFSRDDISSELVFYQHSDSIDIAPKDINKGNAIKSLLDREGWSKEDVVAIGDGENDIPMFKEAGYTIGLNFKANFKVDINVQDIKAALEIIEEKISNL
ncbi:hypothetical protein AM500_06130 [Bacillus sp. FJAT-18017]|uniref:HAD family hydrolase n=1 Tax=Bacillus sp. FJAT-18017 TaxID=1705566 RepID=UPI0006AE523A|nr:HAD family hydrolase [Bacillus sp. FJAT-18017]ALC89407.1 hypothetical protein AM500_06130 [Bacillus sp. FJAT-18017]